MIDVFFSPLGLTFSAILGLIIGSFLNVCIARWPEEKSVIAPPSSCPKCQKTIKWFDNIPLLSWVLLRARCRNCQQKIPLQYPLVELVTGICFAAIHFFFTYQAEVSELSKENLFILLLVGWLLVASSIVVSVVDGKHFIIPDEISLNLMPLGPFLAFFVPETMSRSLFLKGQYLSSLMNGEQWLQLTSRETYWLAALGNSLGGIIVGAGGLWLLALFGMWVFKKEAMGMGDIKLLATLGGFLGVEGVLMTLIVAAILGSVIGFLTWIITKNRKIPFGPWLMVGGLLTYLFKAPLIWALFQANSLIVPRF